MCKHRQAPTSISVVSLRSGSRFLSRTLEGAFRLADCGLVSERDGRMDGSVYSMEWVDRVLLAGSLCCCFDGWFESSQMLKHMWVGGVSRSG